MVRFRLLRAGRRVTGASLAIAAVSLASVLGGCGGTEKAAAGTRATNAAVVAGARVGLHLSEGSYSLTSSSATIHGTATKGASVTVNGRAAADHQGHWRATLQLHIGRNSVRVIATMSGRTSSTELISITRHHNPAELEAKARTRALRAEAERRHKAEAQTRRRRQQALSECTNGTYVNAAGNTVCKPVESSTQPAGATAECEDGTYSFSESRSGTCSHHGGVRTWLNE
jgi:Protein of unknown function (DUF3761)/Glucodextranase, domain B